MSEFNTWSGLKFEQLLLRIFFLALAFIKFKKILKNLNV